MDNFGGIFTTLSQTCKKFDCLRQLDADSVGCLFDTSGVVLELHALKKFF